MLCPECDAELSPQREFCPQCGTPTHRRLREARSSAGPKPGLKRNRRRAVMLATPLLFGVALLGTVSLLGADIDLGGQRRGPAVVEAQQLAEAFWRDADAAEEEYGGREIVVSGEFVRIVPDGNGNPDLRLATSNPAAPWGADLIQVSHEPAARLRPGQRVTVSCQRLAGSGGDRWLQNCALETDAEGDAETPEE